MLLVANLGRVALLVLIGQIAGWQLMAQMLHVPLGVIGFVAACGAALVMLRWAGSQAPNPDGIDQLESLQGLSRPTWLAPSLVVVLTGFALLYSPHHQSLSAATPLVWQFPQELKTNSWPLTQRELDWLTSAGKERNVTAARWRFEFNTLHGSLLFVTSNTWRAQHRPERCFTVYGLEVQETQPLMVENDFPVRWLHLGRGNDPSIYTAAYWLQTADRITEDYAARIWDDYTLEPRPWVLVTVLFDTPVHLQDKTSMDLLTALRGVIQTSFKPGTQPEQ
jgi:exosortase O